jgi:hypothetical protein
MTEVALHLGVHGTDAGTIGAWLSANRARLQGLGIATPEPSEMLRGFSAAVSAPAAERAGSEAELLRAFAPGGEGRIVASAAGLLGPARDVLGQVPPYGSDAARRVYALSVLFPATPLHFLVATCTPSRLAMAMGPQMLPSAEVLDGDTLAWGGLVRMLRRVAPNARVTVWRHEDLPRIWPQVLTALTGLEEPPLQGSLAFLPDLSAEARLRAERFLAATAAPTPAQMQRVAAAFAQKFPRAPGAAHPPLPEWLRVRLHQMDRYYETEWADLAAVEGVNVLS